MRLDRFITLNLVRPFRCGLTRIGYFGRRSSASRLRPSAFGEALPVLMYHSISDDPESGVRPYYRVCTSSRRFREQMQWLTDNGHQGVTLSTGLAWLNSNSMFDVQSKNTSTPKSETGSRCSESGDIKPVAITFDDGFRNFYTAAFPVLREFGFTATMFLPTAFIAGTPSSPSPQREEGRGEVTAPSSLHRAFASVARREFKGRECLAWNEVRELSSAGMEFGSHTVNHPKLAELSQAEVKLEIQNSKLEMEAHLGAPCTTFAYPYAFPQASRDFVVRFKDLLKSSGYEANVTTQIGRHRPGDDALQIKRLPVNQADDLPLFAAKLGGAYDWLGSFQALSKKFRRGWKNPGGISKPADQKLQMDSLVAAQIAQLDE